MRKTLTLIFILFAPLSLTSSTYECVMDDHFSLTKEGNYRYERPTEESYESCKESKFPFGCVPHIYNDVIDIDNKHINNLLKINYKNSTLQFIRNGKFSYGSAEHSSWTGIKEQVISSKSEYDNYSCDRLTDVSMTFEFDGDDYKKTEYIRSCSEDGKTIRESIFNEINYFPNYQDLAFRKKEYDSKDFPLRFFTKKHDFKMEKYNKRAMSIFASNPEVDAINELLLNITYIADEYPREIRQSSYSCSLQ